MKNTNIIRNFMTGGFLSLLFVITSYAAPVVRQAVSATPSNLNFMMDLFRQDLGGANNGTGNFYTSGRREIDWEDYTHGPQPGYDGSPFQFPYDYYNKAYPRGIVFGSPYEPNFNTTTMFISKPSNPASQYVYFHTVSGMNPKPFKPFSGSNMFGTNLNTDFNVNFTIPGTNTPATVKGFGMVFADVDGDYSTYITLYDESGKVIYGGYVNPLDNGFSFVGITFTDGTRITRANIKIGYTSMTQTSSINSGECDFGDCHVDYVAIDNVIFGEPRAMDYHASDFDGDGAADMAVYRPSEGNWYVMNSGSNTYNVVHFGLNGDIPTDGDFDGDSRSDMMVFRPSTGVWYNLRSSDAQAQVIQFGLNGDKPVAGDYDKDGKTDIAVWRPSDGNYYVFRSSDGQAEIRHWGANGDIPIGAGGF